MKGGKRNINENTNIIKVDCFTIIFGFSILWPEILPELKSKNVSSFYYVNISPTGKLYSYNTMAFDHVHLILSQFFQYL